MGYGGKQQSKKNGKCWREGFTIQYGWSRTAKQGGGLCAQAWAEEAASIKVLRRWYLELFKVIPQSQDSWRE
jgi:hypothetical protein